nr:MAG TPA: hypothetical protein [Caudoviricetes sp.]
MRILREYRTRKYLTASPPRLRQSFHLYLLLLYIRNLSSFIPPFFCNTFYHNSIQMSVPFFRVF